MITDIILDIIYALPYFIIGVFGVIGAVFTFPVQFHSVITGLANILRIFDFLFPPGNSFSVLFLSFLRDTIQIVSYVVIGKMLFMIAGIIRGSKVGK